MRDGDRSTNCAGLEQVYKLKGGKKKFHNTDGVHAVTIQKVPKNLSNQNIWLTGFSHELW